MPYLRYCAQSNFMNRHHIEKFPKKNLSFAYEIGLRYWFIFIFDSVLSLLCVFREDLWKWQAHFFIYRRWMNNVTRAESFFANNWLNIERLWNESLCVAFIKIEMEWKIKSNHGRHLLTNMNKCLLLFTLKQINLVWCILQLQTTKLSSTQRLIESDNMNHSFIHKILKMFWKYLRLKTKQSKSK